MQDGGPVNSKKGGRWKTNLNGFMYTKDIFKSWHNIGGDLFTIDYVDYLEDGGKYKGDHTLVWKLL